MKNELIFLELREFLPVFISKFRPIELLLPFLWHIPEDMVDRIIDEFKEFLVLAQEASCFVLKFDSVATKAKHTTRI